MNHPAVLAKLCPRLRSASGVTVESIDRPHGDHVPRAATTTVTAMISATTLLAFVLIRSRTKLAAARTLGIGSKCLWAIDTGRLARSSPDCIGLSDASLSSASSRDSFDSGTNLPSPARSRRMVPSPLPACFLLRTVGLPTSRCIGDGAPLSLRRRCGPGSRLPWVLAWCYLPATAASASRSERILPERNNHKSKMNLALTPTEGAPTSNRPRLAADTVPIEPSGKSVQYQLPLMIGL